MLPRTGLLDQNFSYYTTLPALYETGPGSGEPVLIYSEDVHNTKLKNEPKNDKTNRCKGVSMEGTAIVFRGGITTDAQSKNHKLMTFKETKHTVELVSGGNQCSSTCSLSSVKSMRTHFMMAGIQMQEPIQHHTLFEADRVKIC